MLLFREYHSLHVDIFPSNLLFFGVTITVEGQSQGWHDLLQSGPALVRHLKLILSGLTMVRGPHSCCTAKVSRCSLTWGLKSVLDYRVESYSHNRWVRYELVQVSGYWWVAFLMDHVQEEGRQLVLTGQQREKFLGIHLYSLWWWGGFLLQKELGEGPGKGWALSYNEHTSQAQRLRWGHKLLSWYNDSLFCVVLIVMVRYHSLPI